MTPNWLVVSGCVLRVCWWVQAPHSYMCRGIYVSFGHPVTNEKCERKGVSDNYYEINPSRRRRYATFANRVSEFLIVTRNLISCYAEQVAIFPCLLQQELTQLHPIFVGVDGEVKHIHAHLAFTCILSCFFSSCLLTCFSFLPPLSQGVIRVELEKHTVLTDRITLLSARD